MSCSRLKPAMTNLIILTRQLHSTCITKWFKIKIHQSCILVHIQICKITEAAFLIKTYRITMSIYRQETTSSTVAICKQNFYIIQLCHEQDLGLSTFFAFLIYQFLQLDNFSCAYIFCLISVQNKHTIFCTPLERATHPRALPFWGSPPQILVPHIPTL